MSRPKITQVKIKDHLVTGEMFSLAYDENMQALCTVPSLNEEELQKYYDSDAYISHTDSQSGIIGTLYQWVKKYTVSKKLTLITSLNKGTGSLLDIGAGTGAFLELSNNFNWNVSGVEPNLNAKNVLDSKGIQVASSIDALAGQKFDVVTLWHVLEHFPNIENTVYSIEELVKPGGILVVAVPNYKSFDAIYFKEYWAAYDVPRHQWHFSKESMKLLFSNKMELQKIKPMVFDSFYVSLLSESYKSGSKFSIKAILVGLWSNIAALYTKEHSSLIYCYKKKG